MNKLLLYLILISFFIYTPSFAEDWNNDINCISMVHKYSDYNEFKIANKAKDDFTNQLSNEIIKGANRPKNQNKLLILSFENSIKEYINAFEGKDIEEETYFKALKWQKIDKNNIEKCANYIGANANLANQFENAVQKFLIENLGATADGFERIIELKKNRSSIDGYKPFIQLIKSNDDLYSYISKSEFKDILNYPEFKNLAAKNIYIIDSACPLPNRDATPIAFYDIQAAYPIEALNFEINGKAEIDAYIDSEGIVKSVEITSYSSNLFNSDSVKKAAINTRFIPAQKDCVFVSSKYTFKLHFIAK